MSKKNEKKGITFKTINYRLKFHGKKDREKEVLLRFLCHVAKNVYNNALYALRQSYFETKTIPSFFDLNKLVKDNDDSKILNSFAVLCINRDAHEVMHNFVYKKNYAMPKYLEKKGYYPFITEQIQYEKKNQIKFPMSNLLRTGKIFEKEFQDKEVNEYIRNGFSNEGFTIEVPERIVGKEIKRMSIIPKENAKMFEVSFTYIDDTTDFVKEEGNDKYLSIDLGVRNLATCVDSANKNSFIIDGKIANSTNRYYNKEIANEMARIASKEENTFIKESPKLSTI